jgi:uncharacterized membrane protein
MQAERYCLPREHRLWPYVTCICANWRRCPDSSALSRNLRQMNRELVSVVLLAIGTLCTSFVLGANIYEQIVFIPTWLTPEGIETWRTVVSRVNPGYFFLTFAPAGLIALAASTMVGWNDPGGRYRFTLAATLAVFAGLALTAVYFVPTNLKLFLHPSPNLGPEQAAAMIERWIAVNRVRATLAFAAVVCAMIALRR